MFEQVLVPSKNNATVTLPADLYGMEVKVMVFPVKKLRKKNILGLAEIRG